MATLTLPTAHTCSYNGVVIKMSTQMPSAWHCYRKLSFLNRNQMCMQRQISTVNRSLQIAAHDTHRLPYFRVSAASQSSAGKIMPNLGVTYDSKKAQKGHSYLFRTEIGGLVKVVVEDKNMKYTVSIEVSSLPCYLNELKLVLGWRIFRSDSSCLYVPDLQIDSSSGGLDSMRRPFTPSSLGRHTVTLEFDHSQAPFYLKFLLYPNDAAATDFVIRTHRKTTFCVPVGIGPGQPLPLGVSVSNDRLINFSLFSKNADSVILCLYDGKKSRPSLEIELDPYVNRTGGIWHVSMETVKDYVYYGYRCKGEILWDKGDRFHMRHVLLDPYAKMIGKFVPNQDESVSLIKCLGSLQKEAAFDWSDDVSPRLPMEKLVVYRLNVDQFTRDSSSGLPEKVAGTFAGVVEKVQHFLDLGINAVLLEPIFPFDEKKGPYFPYHFFSLMNSYGLTGDCLSAVNSMKEMVKNLHAHGIEVFLEVVFTHTSEGGDAACQSISFRGIDNSSYYIVSGDMGSGANNAVNCNNPVVQQLIVDSLRHWVTEFHVDGFCFVNSSSLVRSSNGDYLSRPPLVEAIAFDPLLSKTKIIADCWSPIDMLCSEIHFPHWKRWAQINTRFCSDVRSFLRGEGLLSNLATRLCGSGDLFSDSRGPAFSFNYIARNFGLSLVDLVSYSSDELASELSWNCGEEGPTDTNTVLWIRLKQIRNFLFVLFISLGIPVLNMGDECGHSNGGSPAYIDRQPIDWNCLNTRFGMQITQFIAFLVSLKMRRSDAFQRREFLKVENINWHGSSQSKPKWEDPSCKFLSMLLKGEDNLPSNYDKGDLFISFNASNLSEPAILPELSEELMWFRLVDTSLPFPGFFSKDSDTKVYEAVGLSAYEVKPNSCALFEARKINDRAPARSML